MFQLGCIAVWLRYHFVWLWTRVYALRLQTFSLVGVLRTRVSHGWTLFGLTALPLQDLYAFMPQLIFWFRLTPLGSLIAFVIFVAISFHFMLYFATSTSFCRLSNTVYLALRLPLPPLGGLTLCRLFTHVYPFSVRAPFRGFAFRLILDNLRLRLPLLHAFLFFLLRHCLRFVRATPSTHRAFAIVALAHGFRTTRSARLRFVRCVRFLDSFRCRCSVTHYRVCCVWTTSFTRLFHFGSFFGHCAYRGLRSFSARTPPLRLFALRFVCVPRSLPSPYLLRSSTGCRSCAHLTRLIFHDFVWFVPSPRAFSHLCTFTSLLVDFYVVGLPQF